VPWPSHSCGDLANRAAAADDGDGGAAAIFIDRVGGRSDLQSAVTVVVDDGQRALVIAPTINDGALPKLLFVGLNSRTPNCLLVPTMPGSATGC